MDAAVEEILAAVRQGGDGAVRDYTRRFDGADLEHLRVSEAELDAALAEMENLGLSKLITYQNTLFQANKAKLGLTYAYPGNQ